MESTNEYTLNGNFYRVDIFNNKERNCYYLAEDSNLKVGTPVVVTTPLGLEYGIVSQDVVVKEIIPSPDQEIRKIVRLATEEDQKKYEENKKLSAQFYPQIVKIIDDFKLPMKVIEVKYTLDNSKVLVTYVSEERVDFRDLLKELANILKCRIELRQIGVRDRSAIVGAIGVCGLPTCCSTFLDEFDGISINMAKNQMLSLNIQKLSGHCGKLLCCLKYEDNQYTDMKKGMPKIGYKITYKGIEYKISSINYISQVVKLENEDSSESITINELKEIIKND